MLKIKDNVDLKELEKFGFFSEFEYETDYSEDYQFAQSANQIYIKDITNVIVATVNKE